MSALDTEPEAPTSNPERLAYSDRDLDAAGILSRKTRYNLRKAGKFPQPRQVGARQLYVAEEIRAWLDDPEGWAARRAEARG